MKTNKIISLTLVIVLMIWIMIAVPGCKEFNDEPAERTGNVRISLKEIKQQLGITSDSATNSGQTSSITNLPGDTEATNPVQGLIIGMMLVTSRTTPYTSDVAMTEAVVENMTDELTNSQQFIVTLKLPTDKEFVEFLSPKKDPATGGLQIIAAAVDFPIEELAQVGEDGHDKSLIYFGFVEKFYRVDDIGDSVLGESLIMRRACLNNNAIKGCATFPDKLNESPIVTSAVEILGVRYNDDAGVAINDYTAERFYSTGFPIKVENNDSNKISAIDALQNARQAIITQVSGSSNLKNLTVLTTHSKNPLESDQCRTFWSNTANYDDVAELEQLIHASNTDTPTCDIQLYKVPISGN